MTYTAVISRLKRVRNHPNADRLKLATASGEQVIVGIERTEDDIGIYFPSDGCLSHDMCHENNLFSDGSLNKDKERAAFFSKDGRVKAQNFRGEKSYGFWIELPSLSWTGVDLSTLKEGLEVTELNGKEVCRKWINPETLRRHGGGNRQKIQKRLSNLLMFKEHFDTPHLKRCIGDIPAGATLYISAKAHGCVDRDTIVDTLEYGPLRIQQVVEEELSVHIKSLNMTTGETEYAPVEGWYFQPDDSDWYKIELEDGTELTITGNNPVWLPTAGAYRRAEDLTVGDILLTD